jgi:hypothetical protein
MRKTLLIAGAALAASIISSQAQTVYSQNVVGYVNQTIPAGHFQIIGSQLINGSDVNQTNGDINLTLIQGLISSPAADPRTSTNSQMLYWNGAGFNTFYFYNAADASIFVGDVGGDPAGWYDLGANAATIKLNNGKAAFIHNVASVDMTVTTVGTVFQGTNVVTINPGFNLINLLPPVSTNLVVDASGNHLSYGLPLNLVSQSGNPSKTLNDYILYWNGAGYTTYYFYNAADASVFVGDTGGDPAGFYDAGANPMPVTPSVNQGFFLYHNGVSAISWTNSFSVQ